MKDFNKLLEEAVADAKTVKETAVKAAMSSLKETFEPTLRGLVTQKLSEEDELEMEAEPEVDSLEEEDLMDDGADGTPADDFDADLDEILKELDGDLEDEEEEVIPEPEMAPEAAPEAELEPEAPLEDEEDIDLDEIIAEMEGELESEDEDITELKSELTETKRKLKVANADKKKAYDTVLSLKGSLNEMNLLNSKLLYLAKVNEAFTLPQKRQLSILKQFDRCSTMREVKLTYTNIVEGLKVNSSRATLKESASKRTTAAKKQPVKTEQTLITERFQKLAGIIQ